MKKIVFFSLALAVAFGLAGIALAENNGLTNSNGQKNTLDLVCVQRAVQTRETGIQSANTTLSNAVQSALQTRGTALVAAWGITDRGQRAKARNTAWSIFKTARKTARNTYIKSVNATWKQYKLDAKACKVAVAGVEPEGTDVSLVQ